MGLESIIVILLYSFQPLKYDCVLTIPCVPSLTMCKIIMSRFNKLKRDASSWAFGP